MTLESQEETTCGCPSGGAGCNSTASKDLEDLSSSNANRSATAAPSSHNNAAHHHNHHGGKHSVPIRYDSFQRSTASPFLTSYDEHVAERAALANRIGVDPKPLDATQIFDLITELRAAKTPDAETDRLVDLLTHRVPPGVDEAAKIKAEYLSSIALGREEPTLISKTRAVELLGTMQGGYNVNTLVQLLSDPNESYANLAATQLKKTLLIFDAFDDVARLSDQQGNAAAKSVVQSWANAEWFTSKPSVPNVITVTVFKVPGETNTDDLSPAQDAWSRPDIPLHATAMHKNARPGVEPLDNGTVGPLTHISQLKQKGYPLAYVGDVVGTGSSRKSATNSVLWFMGNDIPYVPNIRSGGICIGGKIAPIFFNTMEDSGALPLEMDVSHMDTGDVIDIYPYEGKVRRHVDNMTEGAIIAEFSVKTPVLLDEVRAGGRIPLIIGRALTTKARAFLGQNKDVSDVFQMPETPVANAKGYTLAQKMVGKACGKDGVVPGEYCEPKMTTVGSQDTTGPMTRDELRSLACLHFSTELFMQSFCHTAAYPKPIDVETHKTLPKFVQERGGVAIRPGDGTIHAWLNRMLLPDTVGTGGDSHTRFPIGISFPAGSGLVAFAGATGTMPLDMPESVLVRFKGTMQPSITLRDLVQSIPYTAIQQGLLTIGKKGKKNIFSGRIIEIEGLPDDLTCEQAFELADSTAERSAAGCTVKLGKDRVAEYLKSNIVLLKWLITEGYGDAKTIERRVARMEDWLVNPTLLEADADAEYAAVIEINMDELTEPVLALPNDPDASALLSDVQGSKIDEVFIGSCMTNIGHFRAAGELLRNGGQQLPTRLWMAPPTKMDQDKLRDEGYYSVYGTSGARMEIPGCSLCMGNQARVAPNSTVISSSTRNFPNRLGQGANVYLGSAELCTIAAMEGCLPTVEKYRSYMEKVKNKNGTYNFLKFDQLPDYADKAKLVNIEVDERAQAAQ